jgi:hypothetical protein
MENYSAIIIDNQKIYFPNEVLNGNAVDKGWAFNTKPIADGFIAIAKAGN